MKLFSKNYKPTENKENKDSPLTHIASVLKKTDDIVENDYIYMIGKDFGDYVITDNSGRNSSRHIVYTLTCKECGHTIKLTRYDLTHRKNFNCPQCCHTCPACNSDNTQSNMVVTSDDTQDCDNTTTMTSITSYPHPSKWVTWEERMGDMFELPVYYHLAHCIPCDLSTHGKTARKIDELYNLVANIACKVSDINIGDVIQVSNIFTMFPNAKKFERMTSDNLCECVTTLAFMCAENGITHIAMPHIGCRNGHNIWEEVRELVIDIFNESYDIYSMDDDVWPIHIVFCDKKVEE